MANSVEPDQTAPIGAVCSRSTQFASMLNSSVMFGNYLQQTTSAEDIFRCIFILGALRVNLLDFFCSGIQYNLLLSPYPCFISLLYLDLYVLGDDALIS